MGPFFTNIYYCQCVLFSCGSWKNCVCKILFHTGHNCSCLTVCGCLCAFQLLGLLNFLLHTCHNVRHLMILFFLASVYSCDTLGWSSQCRCIYLDCTSTSCERCCDLWNHWSFKTLFHSCCSWDWYTIWHSTPSCPKHLCGTSTIHDWEKFMCPRLQVFLHILARFNPIHA